MLKAVKECLKNWLTVHERLYWYIVVGLAVLGFGIVTAVGCAKLEKANASEEKTFVIPWGDEMVEISNEGYEYYVIFYDADDDCSNYTKVVLSNVPLAATFTETSVRLNAPTSEKVTAIFYGYGQYTPLNATIDDARSEKTVSNSTGYSCLWSGNYHSNYVLGDYPANPYTSPASYSPDAPYLSFEKLEIENRLCKSDNFIGTNAELYTLFFQPSTWTYTGKLNNVSFDDSSYSLNLKFEVEIPTSDYVSGLYDYFGYNSEKDNAVLKHNESLINYWYKDADADFRTITIEYSVDVFPETDGNISYSFTFAEWEYLFRVFSEALQEEFTTYDARWRAVVLSYMHVKKITTEVITTRSNSVVYGGFTTNVFERGSYASCVDVYTSVDKEVVLPDDLNELISGDVQKAEDEHQKQLEDKIKDLEQQLEDITNSQSGFGGNLESTNLWSSFTTLVQGLAGFGPAIASLSSLIGVVLGFLPLQVGAVIASTFLAICVVALIKAIKG